MIQLPDSTEYKEGMKHICNVIHKLPASVDKDEVVRSIGKISYYIGRLEGTINAANLQLPS